MQKPKGTWTKVAAVTAVVCVLLGIGYALIRTYLSDAQSLTTFGAHICGFDGGSVECDVSTFQKELHTSGSGNEFSVWNNFAERSKSAR